MSVWTQEKIKKWLSPAPELAPIAARWKALGFRTLLDRGCGPGRHAIFFAKQGFAVTAIDHAPEAISYLASQNTDITLVLGDIFTLPFQDASFDCVVDYHASFHADTAGYLHGVAELRRVLRAGGEAYVTIKSKHDPMFQAGSPVDGHTLMHPEPHFYADEGELPALFSGFRILQGPAEVRSNRISTDGEAVHYHLLLQKEP